MDKITGTMKRILHITGGMNRAGAETMIMNVYRAIDKTQFQFDFLYFTDKKCDFDEEINNLGGKIYRINEKRPFKRMSKTIELLQQNPQWQTVHAHTLFSNCFHVYAAYKAGVKQRIAHSHNTSDKSKKGWKAQIYQSVSRYVQSRYATHFLACGTAAAYFLFPKQKNVEIIPNAIDTHLFATTGEENGNYLKKEFNLDNDTLVLIQLGRLNKVKNHRFSIDMVERLKGKGLKFRFFIAGQGPLKEELIREVQDRGLSEEILFLGVRTDVPYLLAGADLMLMPSLHEGFPVVLVESQATGIPALIADTISSEVDLGINLVHFESLSNTPQTWADRIMDMMHMEGIGKNERLQKIASQGFDVQSNAKKIEILYQENN